MASNKAARKIKASSGSTEAGGDQSNLVEYIVASRIKFGADYYRRGESIELTAEEAESLLASGLVKAK